MHSLIGKMEMTGVTLTWIIYIAASVYAVNALTDPHSNTSSKDTNNATSAFLEELLRDMDVRIKPAREDQSPIVVKCGFFIVSFGSVSEMSMDYRMSMFFRQTWTDSRLQYNSSMSPKSVSLSGQSRDKIWVPDIYFPNEKNSKFHDVTVPNMLLKIYPNGTIIHSVRITLQLSCPMNLAAFPMDTQICMIKLESYAYETRELELQWMEDAVEFDEELQLPQFSFGDVKISTCAKLYKTTGSFSCLKATFSLQRHFGFFLLQTYIPSILIVILSWVSFWINVDAVPARISLGVTTVLTMTTQLSGSTTSIPKVSYPKAIDVWLSACMMFVFAALVEYAFVNDLGRKYQKEKYKKTDDIKDNEFQMDIDLAGSGSSVPRKSDVASCCKWNSCNQRKVAERIDKVSRVLFPAAFFLFNIVYWPVYTIVPMI